MFPFQDPPTHSTSPTGETVDHSLERLVRERLDRETDLIIQRTAWVVGSQAFLFTAYAVSLNGPEHAATPEVAAKTRLLIVLIPWVSLVSLLLLLVTVVAGIVALMRLRQHARYSHPRVHILEEGPIVRVAALVAPLLVPMAFLGTWLALLLHS